MPAYKFVLARAAIIDEYYEVDADSEEEALELAYCGLLGDPCHTEFVDWKDNYQIQDIKVIDPLYRMVKDYNPVE